MGIGIAVVGENLVDLIKVNGSFEPHVGGSPLNTAVGLARLGDEVSYITRFSHDFFGEMIKETLKREGVDISLSPTDDDLHTTLSFVFVDERGIPRFAIWNRSTADTALSTEDLSKVRIDRFEAFHFGSILFSTPASDHILRFMEKVRSRRKPIFFDPNYRPHIAVDEKKYKADLIAGWHMSDLVKCSVEDVRSIFDLDDLEDIVEAVKSIGVRTVITDGENGAHIVWKKRVVHVPAMRVETVDTTGCGDAFMAGLIHKTIERRLHDLDDVVDAVIFATAVAAIVATRVGAADAMPREEEAEEFLRKQR